MASSLQPGLTPSNATQWPHAFYLLIFSLLLLPQTITASERQTEEALKAAIDREENSGSAEWLESGSDRFLGIYTKSEKDEVKGTVLLLHDAANHADWPEVIRPLRTRLPDHGWHTLSISLPANLPAASLGERVRLAVKRVQTGLTRLKGEREQATFILGHGWGVLPAARFMVQNPKAKLTGLVMVGAYSPPEATGELALPALLNQLTLPILDIHGVLEDQLLLEEADEREKIALEQGNGAYRRIAIPGAGHGFRELEAVLIKRVRGWMEKLATAFQP